MLTYLADRVLAPTPQPIVCRNQGCLIVRLMMNTNIIILV